MFEYNFIYHYSEEEQCEIYGTLLKTHFILPPPQSSNQEESEEIVSSEMIRKRANEEAMTKLIERVVAITFEVQENIRNMFLPTPQRAHYIFTLNDLCILFRYAFASFINYSLILNNQSF